MQLMIRILLMLFSTVAKEKKKECLIHLSDHDEFAKTSKHIQVCQHQQEVLLRSEDWAN